MIYRLASRVELAEREDGNFLVSKNPLCVLRLNPSLTEMIRRGLTGDLVARSAAEQSVLEQLAAKGFVQRVRESSALPDVLPTVSVVVPVKDRADELLRCLESISRINYPQSLLQVIVVDDGSSDSSADVARGAGAIVIPSGGTGRGPAAARNVGSRAATGDILAFIDSDCTASTNWLAELIPAFDDPKMAAAGGVVDGMCTESLIDRYETVMSSLSLGLRERSGNTGDDTFYLPSCNLLVRRSAFLDVGGFVDTMHVGEDVDLTWRLRDNGWTIAYLPVGRVYHEHRSSLRSFMSRRFDYGTSEGMLQTLHPQRHKRMVVPPLLALLLVLCCAAPFVSWWLLALAGLVLLIDAVVVRVKFIRRKLPLGMPTLLAGRLRALGSLVYYLSFHLIRYYLIPLLAVSLLFPLMFAVTAGMLLCAARVDYSVKKPLHLPFIMFTAVYLMEQVSYGAGVFWGCFTRRTFSSYRVVLLRHAVVP